MRRISRFFLVLASAVASVASAQFVAPATSSSSSDATGLPTYLGATTAPMTLYVSTTGSDANDCASTARACATIQSAVDRVPKRLRHPVTINVGAGTFAVGAWLSGFIPDAPADLTQGSYLIISGTLVTSTVTTGSTSGTLTAVAVGSGSTWTTLTDSGQSWTANQLRGKFIEITSGAGAGIVKAISGNTGTVITLAGTVSGQAPTVGATYTLRDVGTMIDGMVTMAPTPISIPSATTAANASWIIDGLNVATAGSSEGRITIQQFAYGPNVVRSFGIYSDVGLLVRRSRFAQTITNTRVFSLSRSGLIVARDNSVSLPSTGGYVEQGQGGSARVVDMQNNVIDGCGNVSLVGAVTYYRSSGNSVSGAVRVHHIGTVLDGQIVSDKYSGTSGECILGNSATADGTVGQLTVVNTAFGTCGNNVINVNGPMYLSLQDSGSGNTGTTTGYGLSSSEGATIRITSLTAITGTLADLVLDEPSSATSLAALRALSPKRITNTANSVIFER